MGAGQYTEKIDEYIGKYLEEHGLKDTIRFPHSNHDCVVIKLMDTRAKNCNLVIQGNMRDKFTL